MTEKKEDSSKYQLAISDENSPTTLVFIGGDGVQHSPMQFPAGHHLLAFLSCLESGLAPYNRLDPPLWISKEKGYSILLPNILIKLNL